MFLLDFDSQDLGSSSVLDSDYLTMLSSSDKLMSGEFEALARLQAELDLFDDPNRNEEVVEQITVENHLDLIEEEVCSDTGDSLTEDMVKNIKVEVVSNDDLEATVKPKTTETQLIRTIKKEPIDSEDENVIVTLKPPQSEILSISSSNATKRSAPPSVHDNQQSKKAVR